MPTTEQTQRRKHTMGETFPAKTVLGDALNNISPLLTPSVFQYLLKPFRIIPSPHPTTSAPQLSSPSLFVAARHREIFQ